MVIQATRIEFLETADSSYSHCSLRNPTCAAACGLLSLPASFSYMARLLVQVFGSLKSVSISRPWSMPAPCRAIAVDLDPILIGLASMPWQRASSVPQLAETAALRHLRSIDPSSILSGHARKQCIWDHLVHVERSAGPVGEARTGVSLFLIVALIQSMFRVWGSPCRQL